ncbi:MAG: ion transporter [Bacteroidia bacterium]|nr:ion transporter [Bacteroidia bacterium]
MDKKDKSLNFWGVKFFPRRIRRKDSGLIVLDLIMLILVNLNVLLLVFYWIYLNPFFREFVAENIPPLHQILQPVFESFFAIDTVFLVIYLIELAFRWILAIYRKTYHRWFFYPFVHWYDVLGCIPIGSFRFLRILRVFALITRLQRLDILDFRNTYLYSRYLKYRGVVVEEISDGVVVNVLQGMQNEIKKGLPITEKLLHEVILPYKPVLVQWLSRRLRTVTTESYGVYKDDLQDYVYDKIKTAVDQNKEIRQIEAVPVLGKQVSGMLEHAIQDIVFQVVSGLVQDMAGRDHSRFLDEISGLVLETVLHEEKRDEHDPLNEILSRFALDVLEVIKEQVAVQEWKERHQREKEVEEEIKQDKKSTANAE